MELLVRLWWDFIAGPVLALLPARWRRLLPDQIDVNWQRAGTLSGMYELIAAVVAFGYWYMREVPTRIGQIIDATADGRIPVGMDDRQVNGAALTLFYLNPLTWLLLYFFFEGAARLCGAAFTENLLGTFPLYLAERFVAWVKNPKEARVGETIAETAKSILASVRERAIEAARKDVPDELNYAKSGEEEWLEIRASRRKPDWFEPKTVRVGDLYYRLEESATINGPRPFQYRLRRLPAGVPGRSVLLYTPEQNK
jgi:hypothetical protein